MWGSLEQAVLDDSTERIRDFERYRKRLLDENVRRARRSTVKQPLLVPRKPVAWSLDSGHDPYHVRARAGSISFSVGKALRAARYRPRRPFAVRVTKSSGGARTASAFPIVDELISSRLYRALLAKNRSRLSARSYAYRDDIGVHDAIAHIQSEWSGLQRVFVAEYDFTDFFDSIDHDHIWREIGDMGFRITPLERQLVAQFLTAPKPYADRAEQASLAEPRERGVAQGTSISLLLANIAASPLDRELERLGVGFARYADDTLVWSTDYSAICRAVEAMHEVSNRIGVPINQEKSAGVRLLVPSETRQAEMPWTTSVVFLSHAIGLRSTRMKQATVDGLRADVNALLYAHLLKEPLAGTQDLARLGRNDTDYVAYIWQLRRLLYGRLTENEVRRLSKGSLPRVRLDGVLANYPSINDGDALRELDVWIAAQTWLALRKRATILAPHLVPGAHPRPWGESREALVGFRSTSTSTGSALDLRLPSATRMIALVRRAVDTYGTEVIGMGAGPSLYP